MAMKSLQLAVLAAIVAIVAACSSSADEAPPPEPRAATSTTTTSAAATPEDDYIDDLDKTGLFPANVTSNARDIWIRHGQESCNMLKVSGSVVSTRFKIAQAIADYSEKGMAEDGVAERAVVIVAAAQVHLCPEVHAS